MMLYVYTKFTLKTKIRQIESKVRSTTERHSCINYPYKAKAT